MIAARYHKTLFIACTIALSVPFLARSQQKEYVSPAGTKFLLYTPPGYYTTSSAYPLLLSLHSKGEVGDDLAELTVRNSEQMPSRLIYLNRWPKRLPFIVLTPQLKPDPNDPEVQWSAAYIDEVVNYVVKNFRVNLQKIYVTGISRGGTGAWTYAAAFPGKVAALLPISGRTDVTQACRVKNLPIWVFHGDEDRVVPTSTSIDMVSAIQACRPAGSFRPRLNILNARNHNGWNEIYNETSGYKIYDWLLMFRKGDTSNKKPYVNAGPDIRIRARNAPLSVAGDLFDADGFIRSASWRQTAGPPLALNSNGPGLLKLSGLTPGSFEFELVVVDDDGAESRDRVKVEIMGTSAVPAITRLVLVNGKTDTEIRDLTEGQVINKTALNLSEINVRAVATDGTASVRFAVNTDRSTRTLNTGPYLIKARATYPEWRIPNGSYVICATPYTQTAARGSAGVSQCVAITVREGTGECASTGKIRQELWTGIAGTTIASIPVNTAPASVTDLALFEGPANIGDSFGRRIRGYICPPLSGNYVFWISSNDNSELWLSTDDTAANRRRIAYVAGYTNFRQWDKYASQKSAVIALVANRKYYIEALHKEGAGSDHVAVGWRLPTGILERPVPGMCLIPFSSSVAARTSENSFVSQSSGQEDADTASVAFTVFPNPLNDRRFRLALPGFQAEGGRVTVEILSATGEIVYSRQLVADEGAEVIIDIGEPLSPGVYIVTVGKTVARSARRLIVR